MRCRVGATSLGKNRARSVVGVAASGTVAVAPNLMVWTIHTNVIYEYFIRNLKQAHLHEPYLHAISDFLFQCYLA